MDYLMMAITGMITLAIGGLLWQSVSGPSRRRAPRDRDSSYRPEPIPDNTPLFWPMDTGSSSNSDSSSCESSGGDSSSDSGGCDSGGDGGGSSD